MAITYVDKDGKNRKAYDAKLDKTLGEKGVETAFDFFTQVFPDCEFEINEAEKNGVFKDVFDLTVKIPRRVLNVEINVKKMWHPEPEMLRRGVWRTWTVHESGEYPFVFDTMDYCERKNDAGGKRKLPTHHMTVGGDLKRIFLNPRGNLRDEDIDDKWCRDTRQMELFYFCPLPAPLSVFYEKNKKGTWKPVASFDAKGNKK
jgi:hypothetical protein